MNDFQPPNRKHAALYLRVSTSDGQQTEENQRRDLHTFCDREGYDVANEFVDRESGRKGRKTRGGFDAMFTAAETKQFDVLIFWSLDRFSREGIRKTIHYLQQLDALSVDFRSYTEPYLNTDNELVRHILLGVLSHFAAYEAEKISRRTRAGLERARSEGKQIGRPSKFNRYRSQLEALLQDGASKAAMKRETGLAYNTVKKYVERIKS